MKNNLIIVTFKIAVFSKEKFPLTDMIGNVYLVLSNACLILSLCKQFCYQCRPPDEVLQITQRLMYSMHFR